MSYENKGISTCTCTVEFADSNSKEMSKCVRAIGSSSHRGPVISERKKSGSDHDSFNTLYDN
jgi:hypothetical protein